MLMVTLKVPARICFFGDHQDYLGLPVIAGAVDRFIHLQAFPNASKAFILNLSDINSTIHIGLEESLENLEQGDYFRSAMGVLKKKGLSFTRGYAITITSDIPINAGLSSSSALIVAWIRFLITSQEGIESAEDKEIGRWAYEAEVEYFRQPGGLMDHFTIAQSGLCYIDTITGSTERLENHLGELVVAESGVPKNTLSVLKNARVFAQNALAAVQTAHPEFDLHTATNDDCERYKHLINPKYRNHWYAAIQNYQITKQAKHVLLQNKSSPEQLGILMNRHQQILQNQIRNTPAPMIAMMDAVRKKGAFGAKIVGSGGGGCIVAITNEKHKDDVIATFLQHGATAAYGVNLVLP